MDIDALGLLLGAGFLGGIVNAVAGGATLLTFPAMLAAGLPPLTANASNAVAVAPGHLLAAAADAGRPRLGSPGAAPLLATALAGGIAGALLLLVTPPGIFLVFVPLLVGGATALFAFAPLLVGGRPAGARRRRSRVAVLLAASVYGGYFGAGLGVLLLAAVVLTGAEDGRTANACKNLLAATVSLGTIAVFSLQGLVSWPETTVMLAGACAGGWVGGRLLPRLSAALVRRVVVGLGCVMTLVYALRYWG